MSTSLPVLEYPPSFLPGLKLKIVEEKTEEATTALGSLSPTPSDVFICIKHFNSAFKLFPAQDPSLAVTYVGGIKDVPEQINGEAIDFYESLLPDKDSEDEEYDEKGNVKASSSEEVDNEDRDANHVDIVSKGKKLRRDEVLQKATFCVYSVLCVYIFCPVKSFGESRTHTSSQSQKNDQILSPPSPIPSTFDRPL